MSTRFHRTITIFPGVRLNLSKSGMSLSIGSAPLTFNFGRRGSQMTSSLPGSGWSWTKRLGGKDTDRS